MNYYNENNQFAAQWLRELIKSGLIPAGDVDERSIEDVLPNDLKPYVQCHFFAGIGGWPLALQFAGWPKDRPVWTGSVPCVSFSAAGKRAGFADKRHLWPAFFWLIRQCQPPVIFGEQVSTKIALEWWDLVASDLENANYATAAADLPAASVGTPHRRDRLFWVGHSNRTGWQRQRSAQSARRQHSPVSSWSGQGSRASDLDDPHSQRQQKQRVAVSNVEKNTGPELPSSDGCMEYAFSQRREKPDEIAPVSEESTRAEIWSGTARANCEPNPWSECEWIDCLDGKQRPVKPGLRLLADGFPGRVAMLRGFGNAIIPQLAAEFIRAYAEAARL